MVHAEKTPATVDYILTAEGRELVPALDILFIWGVRRMKACDIPVDADVFTVRKSESCIREFEHTTIYLRKVAHGEEKFATVESVEAEELTEE